MTAPALSGSALQLVELIESSPILKPIMAGSPESLGLFMRAANVAEKLRSGREPLTAAVNEAIDTSDLLIEAIRGQKEAELVARIMAFGKAVQNLGELLQEYVPKAIPYVSTAPS